MLAKQGIRVQLEYDNVSNDRDRDSHLAAGGVCGSFCLSLRPGLSHPSQETNYNRAWTKHNIKQR